MLVKGARRPRTRGLVDGRPLATAGMVLALAGTFAVSPSPPARADDSEVTVAAPAGGSVTVEKTENLVNEVIHVSWQGFTPSENPDGSLLFLPTSTRFPVRVYQCRGADPAGPEECYGSGIYDYPGRDSEFPSDFLSHPDGPFNRVDVATAPDGTAAADIEVMTKQQSVTLGCAEGVACSIVVVPNYGDETRQDTTYPEYPACATILGTSAQCIADIYSNNIDAPWAWQNRVVVPLSFAPTAETCGLGDSEASLLGSPKAERAVTSWQAAVCTGPSAVNFDYTSNGEELSRNTFLTGLTDVALTARPVDPGAITDETRTFTYAPVTTSALVVAFRVDNPATGLPLSEMRLSPRLIAKLVTESYRYLAFTDGENPAVDGNPDTIFTDPEFLALNPEGHWPTDPERCSAPLLLADISDLTYELTRYLDADPDTRAFLAGEEDEWGMTINSTFADMAPYPAASFELRDPHVKMTAVFQPVQGLNNVARKLVGNAFAGTQENLEGDPPKPQKCGPTHDGYQPLGSRAFMAIIDSANAAAYRFPQASLLNASGEYVAPTMASMAVAVDEMSVNEDGITRSPNLESTNPETYPLTMIDYAMVPTDGLDAAKAEVIGKVLDYAASSGQEQGQLYGGLPVGFLPLGPDLVTQTAAAAAAVRAQGGETTPSPTPTPTTPTSAPGSATGDSDGAPVVPVAPAAPGAVPAAGAVPGSATPAAGAVPTTAPVSAGPFRPIASETPTWLGVILPIVLIAGLAAAGLGALASWLLGSGGISVPRMPWQRLGAATSATSGPVSRPVGGAVNDPVSRSVGGAVNGPVDRPARGLVNYPVGKPVNGPEPDPVSGPVAP